MNRKDFRKHENTIVFCKKTGGIDVKGWGENMLPTLE
jgi:hypothetical protein